MEGEERGEEGKEKIGKEGGEEKRSYQCDDHHRTCLGPR